MFLYLDLNLYLTGKSMYVSLTVSFTNSVNYELVFLLLIPQMEILNLEICIL